MGSIRDNRQPDLKRHTMAPVLVRPHSPAGRTKISAVAVRVARRKEAAP